MDPMDPRTMTSADWPSVAWLVTLLWVVMVCNVGFATCLLLSHAAVPSLLATGHLKPSLAKLRPAIYVIGFGALVVTAWAVLNWVNTLPVVFSVYDKRLF